MSCTPNHDNCTEFLWHAEVIVSRGEIDAPLFVTQTSWACVSPGTYSEQAIEDNAVRAIAEWNDWEPEAITVVSLTWSPVLASA